MSVVRLMNYVQREFWDDDDDVSDGKDYDGCKEIIGGCRVEKLQDHLVVLHLACIAEGDGVSQELKVGDVVRKVNGVVDPDIKVLFDAMRECTVIR